MDPKITITTPVYWKSNPYVDFAYESLLNQTETNWEWIILLNNKGTVSEKIKKDKRIKIIQDDSKDNKIGRLKKILSQKASSEIIVELDADDMLTENALEEILNAFKQKNIQFVYSNSAEFFEKTWEPRTYDSYWGWRTKPFEWKGKQLQENISFPPYASTIWRIEWAPNHVRAWRKEAYLKIGGHDETLPSGDDHDLICKFFLEYGEKGFFWIQKCIYLYRVHEENHSITNNFEVQEIVQRNYFKYSRNIASKWAEDKKLKLLDLSEDSEEWYNYEKVDFKNLNTLKSNTVGVIKLHNVIQKTKDPIKTMEKIWDSLAHGGILFLEVVSTECNEAFANPQNKSFWNKESAKYYTKKELAEKINFKGKFQLWRNETFYPSKKHEEKQILITQIDLVAIKKEEPILPGPQWM